MTEFIDTPITRFLQELSEAALSNQQPKYLIIVTNQPSTQEDQIMKAIIYETTPNAALVMDPFNVGEIIGKTTPINGASPFPHHPHGIITFAGDVEAVLNSILPWINTEAKVDADDGSWNWVDAIEEGLRNRGAVNFDELPAGVILDSLPAAATQEEGRKDDEPIALPEGWTGESLMEAAFAQRQFQNSGVDRR